MLLVHNASDHAILQMLQALILGHHGSPSRVRVPHPAAHKCTLAICRVQCSTQGHNKTPSAFQSVRTTQEQSAPV